MPVRLQSATARLARTNTSLEAFSPNFDGTVDSPASFTATIGANLQADTASFLGNYQAVSDITGTIGVTLDNFTSNITSNIGAQDNAARINNLLTTIGATVPHTQQYPADPVTTSSATVTNSSELSSNLVNGRQITLQAGHYGSLTMPGVQNVDMICQGAVSFDTLNLGNSGIQRLRITWETPRAGYVRQFLTTDGGNGPTDVLIDGMNMEGGVARAYCNSTRMAIINSRMDAGTGSQAMSSFNQNTEHLTVINCNIEALANNDSVIRLQHVDNLVFVGNRAAATVGGYFPFRIHSVGASLVTTQENAYVAFNQFEGSRCSIRDRCCGDSIGSAPNSQLNLVWEDNNHYNNNSSAAVSSYFDPGANGYDVWNYIRMRRNNAYGGVGTYMFGSPWTGRGYDIGENYVLGTVSAPTWNFI